MRVDAFRRDGSTSELVTTGWANYFYLEQVGRPMVLLMSTRLGGFASGSVESTRSRLGGGCASLNLNRLASTTKGSVKGSVANT